jgi:putative ABC transport system ATP-binding protein
MTTGGPLTTARSVLRASVSGQRRRLGLAALLLSGHQIGEALVPVLVGVAIDAAVRTGNGTALLAVLAALAVDFAVLSSCYRAGARVTWLAEASADQQARLWVVERMLHPGGGAEAGKPAGSLVSVAVADAKRIASIHLALPYGVAALAALAVAAVALLRSSIPLGLLVLLGTPPLLFLLHLLGKPLERRSGPEQERAAQASGVAADLVAGVRVLKGIGAEGTAVQRYTATSRAALAATLRATGAQAVYQGAVLVVNGLFLALIALVGGRLAIAGEISVGQLVAAVGLAQFLLEPLDVFGRVNAAMAQARASAKRVAALLGTPHAVSGGTAAPRSPVRGGVRIRGLVSGPLTGVDLDVAPGELLGVVVSDPAAATELLDCLGREHDPAAGSVELDGVPLADLDPDELRGAVLVAAHDAELFAGTLHQTITTGAPEDADMDAAIRASQADQVITVLPDGTSTAVSEQGRSLSGGQRQRVALARALLRDTPVLVLHDPTTALDTVTEARIAAGLRAARRGRTTILATTSPALLTVVDRVVTVEGGRITAEGSHAELTARDAAYRALVLS